MMRSKVLFITPWYPTKEQPVVGIFVQEHAKAVRLYDELVVLHCKGPDPKMKRIWRLERELDENLAEGIPTYRLWYRLSPIPKTSYFLYLWTTFRAFRHLTAQGFRPDVIHAHIYSAGVPAVLIGRLHKIPVVVTEHFSAFPRKLLSRQEVRRAKLAFRWARVVLPVSLALQRSIEAYGIHARFQVIPNVVDIKLFYPALTKSSNRNPKRFLFVGLLDPSHNKGIPYLFGALAQLRQRRNEWHLDIVGDGPTRAEYERMARELGIADKVTFQGLKSKQEVAEFMRQADLLVLPSLYETFAAVAAEALATGTPVLATRCGGPEEFITDEVGMLVPPGDMQALSEGLDWMLEHLEQFLSEQVAKCATERFSPKQVGLLIHQVYAETLMSHAATI